MKILITLVFSFCVISSYSADLPTCNDNDLSVISTSQEVSVSLNATISQLETESDTIFIYINTQTDFDLYKNTTFPPGTHILFAAGKAFNGQFSPKGSGTSDKPIKVTAYNQETNEIYLEDIDNKPIINGNGAVNSTFYLYNSENWDVNNLEITNTDGTTDDQGDLKGIHVVAEDMGIVSNITIHNCYIHDVNGEVEGKLLGGIHVHVLGKNVKTKFDNLLIENNYIKKVGGVGIGNQSTWKSIKTDDYFPFTNYVLRGNRVEETGRNSIILRASLDAVAEYNVMAYSSRYSTGHNIFNFNTRNCVIQYNEAYGNTGELDDKDRGGFDADYNSENTTFQYNYSHHNHWFCGIMRKYNKGVTIRYNISINDRVGAYEYGFPSDTGVMDVLIHNNTHYFGAGINASPFASPSKTRVPINTTIYNNIFYFEQPGTWAVTPDNSCVMSNNLFYNLSPKGENAISGNPLFVNAGTADTDVDMQDPERLSGYKLQAESPCIDAGISIENNGGLDFWGNSLYNRNPDIGAHEVEGDLPSSIADKIRSATNSISIFPNPCGDVLNIKSMEIGQLTIYDMAGKTVFQSLMNASSGAIDISSLHGGLYMIEVQGKNTYTQKFIKR